MLIQNMPIFITNMSLLTEVPVIPSAVWGTCILEESSDGRWRECHDWKERVPRCRIAGKGLAWLVRTRPAALPSSSPHSERRGEPVAYNPTLLLPHTGQRMLPSARRMVMFGPGVLGRKRPWKARDSCRAGKAGRGQGTQCPWGGSSIAQAALSPVPAGVPCHQAVPKDSDTPAVRLLPRDRPHLWAPACPQGSEGTPVCGVPQDLLLPGPPSTALLCELCPLLGLEGAQASRLL